MEQLLSMPFLFFLKPMGEHILLFHNCIQYQQKMQQAIDLNPAKNTVTIAGSKIILS
jgi:hypothetical protein